MELTPKQQQTLDIIADFWVQNGFAPSMADIRRQLGLSDNSNGTIVFRIKSLERLGLIVRLPKAARSIKLTDKGKGLVSRSLKENFKINSTTVSNTNEVRNTAIQPNYDVKGVESEHQTRLDK